MGEGDERLGQDPGERGIGKRAGRVLGVADLRCWRTLCACEQKGQAFCSFPSPASSRLSGSETGVERGEHDLHVERVVRSE